MAFARSFAVFCAAAELCPAAGFCSAG